MLAPPRPLERRVRPPVSGPIILSIPGISGVQLGAGATGAIVRYKWPRPYRLVGWMLLPRSGSPAHAAGLRFRAQDERGVELVTDALGIAADANFLPALGAVGLGPVQSLTGASWLPQWTPLERVVRAGDLWIVQVMNQAGVAVTPDLLFQLGEP